MAHNWRRDPERERSTAFESKPNSVNDVLITLKREKS
jgi:hypothetical protein